MDHGLCGGERMPLNGLPHARGKQLLIDAALRLAVETRSIRSIGVRELGREAGLNPNTFYRHFRTMDDLGLALLDQIVQELRLPLQELRRKAASSVLLNGGSKKNLSPVILGLEKAKAMTREMVASFFDFVELNSSAFIVGVSELHGSSPILRSALHNTLLDFSKDLADDASLLELFPSFSRDKLDEISCLIIWHFFHLTTRYIEQTVERRKIRLGAEKFMLTLIGGNLLIEAERTADLSSISDVLRAAPAHHGDFSGANLNG